MLQDKLTHLFPKLIISPPSTLFQLAKPLAFAHVWLESSDNPYLHLFFWNKYHQKYTAHGAVLFFTDLHVHC